MRVGIFIDAGFIHSEVYSRYNAAKLDYYLLKKNLVARDSLVRMYVYDCEPNDPIAAEKKESWFKSIEQIDGIQLRIGKTKEFVIGKPIQKGVDVWLAVDMISLVIKGKIDKAIIITGDSDFVPLIRRAKEEGCVVQLVTSEVADSMLRSTPDETVMIDDSWVEHNRIVDY